MMTRKRYSIVEMLMWTRIEIVTFIIYALFVTFLFVEMEMRYLHIPWTPIALIGTAVAFLITFQNNAAYERTWEARKIWGGIVNASRSWGMKIQDMVRTDQSEVPREQQKEIQKVLVYRHIAWLTALRHEMRQARPWEANREHKTNEEWSQKIHIPEMHNTLQNDLTNYLPLAELDYVMSKTNKPTSILYLQSRHLRKLKDENVLWEFSFLNLEDLLQDMFSLQGQSERIKNFPYPRQYASLSHVCIWTFLILLPFGIVPEFETIGTQFSETKPEVKALFVWGAVPFCALVSWVFQTMERIGRIGENPFEGGPNDVPISTIARGIEIDMRQQINDPHSQIPDPFEEKFDVQM